MILKEVTAGCEAERLVQLCLARPRGLRRWRRCQGWRKSTGGFWTTTFIPGELFHQIKGEIVNSDELS